MTTLASARERNHSTLRHSSRNLPLKLSLVPFCQGLPGLISAVAMPLFGDPFEDRVADELRLIVRAQEERRSLRADELREHLDHALGTDRAGHVDGQALVGELVDHRQALDLLALGGGVEDEVVGPGEVGIARCQRPRTAGGDAPLRPSPWQLQPRLTPQPVRAVYAERVALAAQEDADALVAVAWSRIQQRANLGRRIHAEPIHNSNRPISRTRRMPMRWLVHRLQRRLLFCRVSGARIVAGALRRSMP